MPDTPSSTPTPVTPERSQPFLIDEAAHAGYRVFGVVRIGRAPECTVMVTDPTVSRLHAEVWAEDDKVFIRSLGSNGTRINGNRVPGTWELEEGDQVDVGWTSFRFTAQPLPFGIHGASRGIASAARRTEADPTQVTRGDEKRGTGLVGETASDLPAIRHHGGGISRRRSILIGGVSLAIALAAVAVFVLR